jgi:hypothetical protein
MALDIEVLFYLKRVLYPAFANIDRNVACDIAWCFIVRYKNMFFLTKRKIGSPFIKTNVAMHLENKFIGVK